MLDKSVPYYNVIMTRREKSRLNPVPLPAGFHYEFFRAGDETHWAEIETGVLEFAERSEARKYFEKEYLVYESALSERCIFISTENGQKAGTATAWWSRRKGIKVPSIHWVSIRPEFQGSGLGKAIVSGQLKRQ